ncbi:MAG TPA: RDD family protein [Flavobacterium sp.]|nr:RDD family protein [Flavobacterium sp.]HAT80804.1 RDD family protein [Flavobacterium sp.]
MEEKYPSILDRIKSTLIDTILFITGMLLFTNILEMFDNVPNWVRMVLFISLLMYEPICIAFGGTFGNLKMKIRVRKNSDVTKSITIFQSIIRYFFKVVLGWISILAILISPKSRTLHDMICGSIMIKVDE